MERSNRGSFYHFFFFQIRNGGTLGRSVWSRKLKVQDFRMVPVKERVKRSENKPCMQRSFTLSFFREERVTFHIPS